MNLFRKGFSAIRRLLHVLARPMRQVRDGRQIVIQPYRGYGTHEEIFLIGRVLRQPGGSRDARETQLRRDLKDVLRRFVRWGVGAQGIDASIAGSKAKVTTDSDGYFRLHAKVQLPRSSKQWHEVHLSLSGDQTGETVTHARVYVPPETARFVVISDIDDTIMETGVASKLTMMWRLFVETAQARTTFPGIAAFCRALHDGASGHELNPMLYVSRAPWSIYEVLDEFFSIHRIPVGPILFLREWGLTLQSPLPRRAEGHKRALITNMLALYDELPFILIGDSGQHDPEIYAEIVEAHPNRVRAVYIRNVSRDPARLREIEVLAEKIVQAGSSLVLAADTFAMAEHAAEHGFISTAARADVFEEHQAQDQEGRQQTRNVERPGRGATEDAVAHGAVEQELSKGDKDAGPPNVVVEPGSKESSCSST